MDISVLGSVQFSLTPSRSPSPPVRASERQADSMTLPPPWFEVWMDMMPRNQARHLDNVIIRRENVVSHSLSPIGAFC